MFLLLCIDRVVVDAAVSFRGSSMIITQYGALSMHALENCVNHPLLMVELSTYHDGLTIGACFESGIHRDKKKKKKKKKQTSKCIQNNNKNIQSMYRGAHAYEPPPPRLRMSL